MQDPHIHIARCDESYNLVDHLLYRHLREGREANIALLFEGQEISYAEVAKRTSAAVWMLRDHGIGRCDRVALILPDTPAFVYLFLATISLGAIVVPISPRLSDDDSMDMCHQVGASLIVSTAGASHAEPSGMTFLTVDELLADIAPCSASFTPEVTAGSDPLYLLFSSGTTGRPKAIIRRHADISWTAAAFARDILEMKSSDRVLAVPKLSFGYALAGNLLFSLLHGATAVLIRMNSTVDAMIDAICRYRPSIFLAQPRMLADIVDRGTLAPAIGAIRATVSAGDVLPDPLRRRWLAYAGADVIDGFGSTEAGHIFVCNRNPSQPTGSSGQLLSGYSAKIIDAEGTDAPDGVAGRLCLRGPSVSQAYWNDPDRTRSSFVEGWFVSDDMFVRHDGHYFYQGRRDDMIKTGCGEWVSPHHLESVLLRDQAVRDCAVVGAHDDRSVVRVKAFIVRAPGDDSVPALENRLKQLAETEWPKLDHMRIHMIEYVESIPRSANGKIQRQRLNPRTLTDFAYAC